MLYRKINIWSTLDWWIVGLYLLFVSMGWLCIRATTYGYDNSVVSDRAMIQLIWIISSFCIALISLAMKNDWYEAFAFVLYLAMILLLGVTAFVASPIKGSRSWLVWGPLRIQPAEFAKVTTALAIAKVLELYQFCELKKGKICSVILILLPALLILLQKETGSALVFLFFFWCFFEKECQGKYCI